MTVAVAAARGTAAIADAPHRMAVGGQRHGAPLRHALKKNNIVGSGGQGQFVTIYVRVFSAGSSYEAILDNRRITPRATKFTPNNGIYLHI